METIAAAPSPYQFGHHKLLHLVRHAQGMHNLESEKSRDPLTSFELFDAELSSLGWQQVHDQRKDVCASELLKGIEVVITSPIYVKIEKEDDILWKADEREPREVVIARGMKFIKWLWTRKEKEIAVVSHGVFLQQAMIELIKNNKCYPLALMDDDPCSRVMDWDQIPFQLTNIVEELESLMDLNSKEILPRTMFQWRNWK